MARRVYLAADLGASSGRLLAGLFDGERLSVEEVHRFANGGVRVGNRLHWDLLGQWSHMLDGLRKAGSDYREIRSVGVDTWGVDYGLVTADGELLGNPYHYRDARTQGMMEAAFQIMPREEIFRRTGLQLMVFNTLFQLLAARNSPLLAAADRLLMIPDLFHWLLSGEHSNEYTDASTTQCLNVQTGEWDTELLEQFGIPTGIFGPITAPGTVLGPLQSHVERETGLSGVQVVLPGTHDTASAVLAVPTSQPLSAQPDWCFLSSGTWSLLGAEVPAPVINDTARRLNFTNEGGIGGSIRLLKNIAGLWLVQECRRIWSLQGTDYSWDRLVELAEQAEPHRSLIDPDHPDFVVPEDMPAAIAEFCRRSGQPVPESEGAVIRCALESVALRYRNVLRSLEQLTGRMIATIHIVGGGTKNRLLSQMAADACGVRVVAGPVEATAIGNVLMQAVASGDIRDIAEARTVVQSSFDLEEFEPRDTDKWDEAFARWEVIVRAASDSC